MEATNPRLTLHESLQQVAANARRNGNGKSKRVAHTTPTEKGDKYGNLEKVKNLVLLFIGITGVSVSWKVAAATEGGVDWLMFIGQAAGFCASTIFLYIISKAMRTGKYIGEQYTYAKRLYFWGVLFEGLTIFAKYFDGFVPAYLFMIAFTVPGLAIAISKLIYLDKDLEIKRIKEENERMAIYLEEKGSALRERLRLNKLINDLKIEEFTSQREDEQVLKQSMNGNSRRLIKQNAGERVAKLLGARTGKIVKIKQGKSGGVLNKARTKLIGEGATMEVREVEPKQKKGGRPCKAPGCKNKLKGKQQYYCSKSCAQKALRARKRKELEEATA